MAIIKKTDNKCWWECREIRTLIHCFWECKMVQSFWKTVLTISQKVKHSISYTQPKMGTLMFMETLFVIFRKWKQSKWWSINWWMDKQWYIHIMEDYSNIKRNELLIHVRSTNEPWTQYATRHVLCGSINMAVQSK